MKIDAKGIYYKELNGQIRRAIEDGETEFELVNVNGQRFIGDAVTKKIRFDIHGVPGNDLGVFMNGPEIMVHNNAQDGIANTMSGGKIIIHGMAGDVIGYGMRGGRVHVRDDVGYRVGIHMKSYKEMIPTIVIGGKAGDFLGEYMAGGVLVLLGLDTPDGESPAGSYLATGMHGGVMYIRGEVFDWQTGVGIGVEPAGDEDLKFIKKQVDEFCADFDLDPKKIMSKKFNKIWPKTHRPYGNLYAY